MRVIYIEEGDKELKSFNIDHDRQFRIPMIKRAIEAAGGELLLYVSPWSLHQFMKTNGSMLQGGKLSLNIVKAGQTIMLSSSKLMKQKE